MSDTTTPPAIQPPPTPDLDSLWSPQFIIALMGMIIVGGTVAATLVAGDASTKSQVIGGVMALGGTVVAFYFSSSRGSQSKDATIAAQAAAVTATAAPKPT